MGTDHTGTESDPPEQPEMLPVSERFPRLYSQLLSIAERQLKDWQGNSLSPVDLTHDGFLKLLEEEAKRTAEKRSSLGSKPDYVFRGCFGQACLNILRRRHERRLVHKKAVQRLRMEIDGLPPTDFSELNELLLQLRELSSLKAAVVEHRHFGNMSEAECAKLLQISTKRVRSLWTMAIAWLGSRLADRKQG